MCPKLRVEIVNPIKHNPEMKEITDLADKNLKQLSSYLNNFF
jgi:hypothetical protein